MAETTFSTWIGRLDTPEFSDGKIIITSPTEFRKEVLVEKFSSKIEDAIRSVLDVDLEIVYKVKGEDEEEEEEEREKNDILPDLNADASLNYSFDNFIVGNSNRLAHAAAWRVATTRLGSVYNPLFIYGHSGLGKTHLMMAMQNELKKRGGNVKIVYTTSENFLNEFIACVTAQSNIAFREKYRNCDALFIDDVQFFSKKESTQEEFFHTFNDLINSNRQIVITSDRPPKEIEGLDERIRTRFESGLIADVQPPDVETRTKIIIKKAEENKIRLSKQMINYMAEKIKDNVRQIEGAITKITAMQVLYGIDPSINDVQQIIKDLETDNKPASAVADEIIETVADNYNVEKSDITSEKRNANISLARNVAMYIIREATGLSLESIGNKFGGKKHSTVKHSIDSVEKRILTDVTFKNTVYNILKQFKK